MLVVKRSCDIFIDVAIVGEKVMNEIIKTKSVSMYRDSVQFKRYYDVCLE